MAYVLVAGSIATAAFWGLRAQFETQRQLEAVSDRLAVRQAILDRLRNDLAAAFEIRSGATASELVLVNASGLTRYRIDEASSTLESPKDHPIPLRMMLHRLAETGDEETWALAGQRLVLSLDEGNSRLLGVRFESAQHYETGEHESQSYLATLYAGTGP